MDFLKGLFPIKFFDLLSLFYLFLTTTLLLITFLFFTHPAHLWLLLIAFPLICTPLGNTFFNQILQIILFGLYYILLIFFIDIFSDTLILPLLYLVVILLITNNLIFNYPKYKIQFIFGIFFVIYALTSPGHPDFFMRYKFMGLSILIIAGCQLIFIGHFNQHRLAKILKDIFSSLQTLTKTIFNTLENPAYLDHLYYFEHAIHVEKNRSMKSLMRFKNYLLYTKNSFVTSEKNSFDSLSNDAEQLFNMLMDVATLRFRVSDHTIFAVCKTELSSISKELQLSFLNLLNRKKNAANNVQNQLGMKIVNFEEVFHHALQVTAEDPAVFLFFINTLKRLSRKLVAIQENLHMV